MAIVNGCIGEIKELNFVDTIQFGQDIAARDRSVIQLDPSFMFRWMRPTDMEAVISTNNQHRPTIIFPLINRLTRCNQ